MGYDRFLDTSTSEDHFQDHYYHSTTKLDGSHEVGINPAALVHMSTQSPESSTESSSSRSSTTQYQRNDSLGCFIAEETPASQGIVIGNTNSENRDSEDRFMEKFFDINTAASSPTQSMGTAPTSTPSKTMKPVQMPLRLDSDKHVGLTYGVRSHDRRSNVSGYERSSRLFDTSSQLLSSNYSTNIDLYRTIDKHRYRLQ